jgi:hypothetical protein
MSRLVLHALLHTGLITAAMLSLGGPTIAQTDAQHQGVHHQPMKVETKPFAPPAQGNRAKHTFS